MFCEYCGKQISDNAKFCSNCGMSTLGEDSITTVTTENQPPKTTEEFFQRSHKREELTAAFQTALQSQSHQKSTHWQRSKYAFLKFRCFCCYACTASTIGVIILIIASLTGGASDGIQLISLLLIVLGWLFALFACPIHMIKKVFELILCCVQFGLCLFIVGVTFTVLAGAILGAAIFLAGQCFITIPYCRTVLHNKLLKYKK